MEFKSLSNHELECTLKKKASLERQITVEIISLLEEVSRRRIHLQRGFGSLIEYCIKELGYSESGAYRRISAMRVAQEVPQIKEALASGRLNLVNVSRAQTIFRKEAKNQKPLSKVEKSRVLSSLENQSARQAEKILLKLSPEILPRERVCEVGPNHTQISVVLTEGLMKKLNEIKNLLSHKNPNPSYAELLDMIADVTLEKLRKGITNREVFEPQSNAGVGRTYLAKGLRQLVWQKNDGKCQFRDPISHRQCESKFQLQIEHKQPVAKGGRNSEENLELLCANHNRLRAIKHFGSSHMKQYLGH